MRYLGIDFGIKRVGVAVSDASNTIAVPMRVLPSNKDLVKELESLCRELRIKAIVLGESNDYQGNPNPIQKKIERFKKQIEEATKLEVYYEPEVLSSALAARSQDNIELLDAAAAAIILQSHLDNVNGVGKGSNGDHETHDVEEGNG